MSQSTPVSPASSDVSTTSPSSPPASIQGPYVCETCGREFQNKIGLTGHKKTHEKEEREAERQRKQNRSESDIWADIKMKGAEALEEVMRVKLEDDLYSLPDIPQKSADKALHEWDSDATIRSNMTLLYTMLTEDAGIKNDKAIRICQKLTTLYGKWSGALQQGGHNYFFQSTMSGGPQPQPSPGMMMNPSMMNQGLISASGYPYPNPAPGVIQLGVDNWGRAVYGFPTPFGMPVTQPSARPEEKLTKEDVARIVAKTLEEERDKERRNEPPPVPPLKFRTTKGDVSAEGNTPQEAAWNLKMLLGTGEKSDDKDIVVEAIREANAPLQRDLSQVKDDLKKEQEARHAAELKRMEDKNLVVAEQLTELKNDLKQSRAEAKEEITKARRDTSSDGWHADSYRFIGKGMDRLADVLEKKDIAGRALDFLSGRQGAQQQKVAATTESEELAALAQQGYVVDQ